MNERTKLKKSYTKVRVEAHELLPGQSPRRLILHLAVDRSDLGNFYPSAQVPEDWFEQAEDEKPEKPVELTPPEDGPWSKTCRWDGREKRLPKRGEKFHDSTGDAQTCYVDFDQTLCHILIPLTSEEIVAQRAEGVRERAVKAANDWVDAPPGAQDVADVIVAFHEQELARAEELSDGK